MRGGAARLLRRLADWLDPGPSHPVIGLGTSLHSEIGELPRPVSLLDVREGIGHQGGVVDDDDGWSGGGLYL